MAAEQPPTQRPLLGIGALIGGGLAGLAAIGALLVVIFEATHHALTEQVLGDAFNSLAFWSLLGALMCLAGAYLRRGSASHAARRTRLTFGAGFLGVFEAFNCVAAGLVAVLYATHHVPGIATSSVITEAVGSAVSAGALFTAASALALADVRRRHARLIVAAAIAIGSSSVGVAAAALAIITDSRFHASSTGDVLVLAGTVLELAAGTLLVFAFLAAERAARRSGSSNRARDGLVSIALAILSIDVVLEGVAKILDVHNAAGTLDKTGIWLQGAGMVLLVTVTALACIDFAKSGLRREQTFL